MCAVVRLDHLQRDGGIKIKKWFKPPPTLRIIPVRKWLGWPHWQAMKRPFGKGRTRSLGGLLSMALDHLPNWDDPPSRKIQQLFGQWNSAWKFWTLQEFLLYNQKKLEISGKTRKNVWTKTDIRDLSGKCDRHCKTWNKANGVPHYYRNNFN